MIVAANDVPEMRAPCDAVEAKDLSPQAPQKADEPR